MCFKTVEKTTGQLIATGCKMIEDSAPPNRIQWLAFQLLIEQAKSYVWLETHRIAGERSRVLSGRLSILRSPGQPVPRCVPASSLDGCHFITAKFNGAEGCGNLW